MGKKQLLMSMLDVETAVNSSSGEVSSKTNGSNINMSSKTKNKKNNSNTNNKGKKKQKKKKRGTKNQNKKNVMKSKSAEDLLPLTDLKLGSEIEGYVAAFTSFGIFIKTNFDFKKKGSNGYALLHKSQIRDEPIEDLTKLFRI